ncbi:THUMP-like domain-containing protein [Pontimicrobium sp. MEBiC01747]
MNYSILNTEHQEFINANLNSDIASLLLKGIPNTTVEAKAIIEQIEAKKRCKKKLPTWFNTKQIYYPNKLNIEQTSSEITAKFKASLISGNSIIDLTGGFGVDCYYFSKVFKDVVHCEINNELSQKVSHNYKQLAINNVNCINQDGIEYLLKSEQKFDYIYIDPSRRNDAKGKVFLLNDCLPNIPKHLDLLFKRTKTIVIKTSPLLDVSIGINELKYVKTIYSVAVNNEVKELLWVLDRDFNGEINIQTTNLLKTTQQTFQFYLNEEAETEANYSEPLTYLYEPNAAILKMGAFNSISSQLNLNKLQKHSHLYTSNSLITFPGRRFKIEKIIDYNKKLFKKEMNITKANVTTRNFPETVQTIRKKLKIKDGGNYYLFFTTLNNTKKVTLSCSKID